MATMDDVVRVFDTTLCVGERAPGASMSVAQKVEVARQLDGLGVDVIEAGFPAASPNGQEAVASVARNVRHAQVAALARCSRNDIEAAARALQDAERPILHVFVATSDLQLKHKLHLSRTEVVHTVAEMVAYARELCPTVEFSAEDATRSDLDYLARVCDVAVRAGASIINLPDTIGHAVPEEYGAMFHYVRDRVDFEGAIIFSAHCHNDLGLATANTLAAVQAGARQVEVTMNGLGERAGNAALEEVVMALHVRGDALHSPQTTIKTEELGPSSRLVSQLTGWPVQANKAVVGANAFSHAAETAGDGPMQERTTYEIMSPADVGWETSRIVLGRYPSRHDVEYRLRRLGFDFDQAALDTMYARIMRLAEDEPDVTDAMLRQLAADTAHHADGTVRPAYAGSSAL